MVQIHSQKYSRMFFLIFISCLACNQIQLNLPMDHHHFGYVTKLTYLDYSQIQLNLPVDQSPLWLHLKIDMTFEF
jgi:hypothetical protein